LQYTIGFEGIEMKPKSIIVLTIVLAFALTAMSLNAARPLGDEVSEADATVELALEFVKNSPTFLFDGMSETVKIVDTIIMESYPVQYVVIIEFDSRHAGFGDRTGEVLAQGAAAHRDRDAFSVFFLQEAIVVENGLLEVFRKIRADDQLLDIVAEVEEVVQPLRFSGLEQPVDLRLVVPFGEQEGAQVGHQEFAGLRVAHVQAVVVDQEHLPLLPIVPALRADLGDQPLSELVGERGSRDGLPIGLAAPQALKGSRGRHGVRPGR